MKKLSLLLALAAMVAIGCKSGEKGETYTFDDNVEAPSQKPDMHNSRNSLDWAGVYEATSPCDDCDGIRTRLKLNEDETFELTQKYLGKDGDDVRFNSTGQFKWDDNDSDVILNTKTLRIRFQVGENEVTMLDMKGNVVSGELASFYVLKKTSN